MGNRGRRLWPPGSAVPWSTTTSSSTARRRRWCSQGVLPGGVAATGTLLALSTFGVGYVSRPIGGLLWGTWATGWAASGCWCPPCCDGPVHRAGRLPAQLREAGVAAPVLLVALRLLQGFSAGGEQAGANSTTWNTPRKTAGRTTQLHAQRHPGRPDRGHRGVPAIAALPAAELLSWGWRVPFWPSAVMVVVGHYIGRWLGETPVFEREVASGAVPRLPLVELFADHWADVLRVVVAALIASVSTIFTVYALSYAVNTVGLSKTPMLWVGVLANVAAGSRSRCGRSCREDRPEPLFIGGSLGCAVLIFAYLGAIAAGSYLLIFIIGIGCSASSTRDERGLAVVLRRDVHARVRLSGTPSAPRSASPSADSCPASPSRWPARERERGSAWPSSPRRCAWSTPSRSPPAGRPTGCPPRSSAGRSQPMCLPEQLPPGPPISRRAVLGAGIAGAAAAVAAPAAASAQPRHLVDLTHVWGPEFPVGTSTPAARSTEFTIERDGFYAQRWSFWEHTGTHVDAPGHFVEGGRLTPDLRPDELMFAPVAVIDVTVRAARDPDTQVRVDDLRRYERRHGRISFGALVVMNSGWWAKAGDPSAFRNADPSGTFHFPGFSAEAAEFCYGAPHPWARRRHAQYGRRRDTRLPGPPPRTRCRSVWPGKSREPVLSAAGRRTALRRRRPVRGWLRRPVPGARRGQLTVIFPVFCGKTGSL